MLTKLRIQNFQRWTDLTVEFDPYVTVFVGKNAAGKSSVLRALWWTLMNQWEGKADKFITHGEVETINIAWIDGHKIVRGKGPSDNYFKLDGKILEAFGSGKLPQEIADLVNLTEANYQTQLDPPFWFSLTSGQLGKSLNKIVDLDVIDGTLTAATSKVKAAKTDFVEAELRLKADQGQLGTMTWIDDAEAKLATVLDAAKAAQALDEQWHSITRHLIRAKDLKRAVDTWEIRYQSLQDCVGALKEAWDTTEESKRLSERLERSKSYLKRLQWQEKRIQELEVELAKVKVCPACGQTL